MAEKGARLQLEGVARQMFIDGKALTEIGEILNVSRQTLTDWKARTRRGDQEADEWDQGRERKRGRLERLQTMFDEQLDAMEELPPLRRDSKMMDALGKLGALIKTWSEAERIVKEVRAMVEAPEQKSVSADDLRRIIKESYGV